VFCQRWKAPASGRTPNAGASFEASEQREAYGVRPLAGAVVDKTCRNEERARHRASVVECGCALPLWNGLFGSGCAFVSEPGNEIENGTREKQNNERKEYSGDGGGEGEPDEMVMKDEVSAGPANFMKAVIRPSYFNDPVVHRWGIDEVENLIRRRDNLVGHGGNCWAKGCGVKRLGRKSPRASRALLHARSTKLQSRRASARRRSFVG